MRRADDREKEKVKGSREEFQKVLEGIREDVKMIPRLEQSLELLLARMEELMNFQHQDRRNFQTTGVEAPTRRTTPREVTSERVRQPREIGTRSDLRTGRVVMPTFNGENSDGWTFRAESFFAMNGLTENEKLDVAVASLDGEALAWFRWEDGRRMIRNWPELKAMILERFRSQSTSLFKSASPNDKSYGLSPNDESFSPRGMASVPNDESFPPRSMASVRHLSEVPVELGSVRAIATRDGDTEGPDSGRIWTRSGDSSELEWEPNHIRTGLRDFRARDEGRKVGRGEIALDSEDSRRKGLVHGGLWSERKRQSRAATFGAGLTISDAAATGLDKWAAVWASTHNSGNVEAVSGRYSSNPLNSGDNMLRAWKFGFKPGVGGAEFRNSGQMGAGSRVSGVGRTDSCLIRFGLRNSIVNGPTSGSIEVGPKRKFNKSGSNCSKLCNWSSNFGPSWTESGNSSTFGAKAGEIDFIGVGLGHSAKGRCVNSEFVTPKTKISMFHGLNNGSNGFFALVYTFVAPFPSWFVTVEVGSSRIAMPFNIRKGGLDDIGRRWRHSTAVT